MSHAARSLSSAVTLRRHVPELAVSWQQDSPERRWRRVEGTLCFADISGFTALAERLSLRGRAGGEELVETLGRVFAGMLDTVHGLGGDLLKFGGDALLLFFHGEGHAVRAASAAVDMRRTLRGAAELPTSVGPLRLTMSVGLHSGEVLFLLVGGAHRELLVLGDAANTVVELENAARSGEILVSEACAAALSPDAVKSRDDGRLLLRWRDARSRSSQPGPAHSTPAGLVETLFPKHLGSYLADEVPEPEHRLACIAFVRLSGTDALLAEAGEAALAAAVETLLAGAQQRLAEEGVTLLAVDVDRDGAKLFLAAGVPFGGEDDEGAMLRAVKRILALPLPSPLTLQAGAHRGHVFVAEVGGRRRAAYSAMGDVTNTAARLCAKAPPGVVYAHPDVLDECQTLYQVTPSTPLAMKGKKAPLVAYAVGRESGRRNREGLATHEHVGRELEVGVLQAALADLKQGSGGVVCIHGGRGLGKSRLLQETLGLSGAEPLLAVRGEPYGARSPYRALRDPLRALLGLQQQSPPEMTAALARAVSQALPDAADQVALLGPLVQVTMDPSEAVRAIDARFLPERRAALLARMLAVLHPGPAILLVDDAQWLDDASALLLERLAEVTRQEPWLLLVARRADGGGFNPGAATAVNLAPLGAAAMRRLVLTATEATPLRAYELNLVLDRAAGNPLHAMEILRAAREVGSVEAVPLSLEAALSAQVDAQDPHTRRVLRYASIFGRSFSVAALAELLERDGQGLGEMTLRRVDEFLAEDGEQRRRFRSGILRDTIYQGIAYRTRARLHGTAAALLERNAADPAQVADNLSLHYAAAGDHPRTWQFARLAGDRARDAYANVDAAAHYQRAIAAARHLPDVSSRERVAAWLELGNVQERASLFTAAWDSYREALKLVGGDALSRAQVLYRRSVAKERIGSFAAALRDCTLALTALGDQDTDAGRRLRAQLTAHQAMTLFGADRPGEALARARAAESLAREMDEHRSLAEALVVQDLASLMLEGPGDGARLREALDLYEQLGDLRLQASVRANLGFLCAYAGRWSEAVTWLTGAADLFQRSGDEVNTAHTALNLGEMLVKQGRYDEAERTLNHAVRVMRAAHLAEGVHLAELRMAQLMVGRGQYQEADCLAAEVVKGFDLAGQTLNALEAATVRASALLGCDQASQALTVLADAARRAGRDADLLLPLVACQRGAALAAEGALAEAESDWAQGLAAARERHQRYEEAILLKTRAALTASQAPSRAREDDAAAAVIFSDLGVALP